MLINNFASIFHFFQKDSLTFFTLLCLHGFLAQLFSWKKIWYKVFAWLFNLNKIPLSILFKLFWKIFLFYHRMEEIQEALLFKASPLKLVVLLGKVLVRFLGKKLSWWSFQVRVNVRWPLWLIERVATFIRLPHPVHDEHDQEDGAEQAHHSPTNNSCKKINISNFNNSGDYGYNYWCFLCYLLFVWLLDSTRHHYIV